MLIQPLVSVLMTAYNREMFIAEAIESVLASTFENFELIIVDDFSIDNTVNIAKEYQSNDSRVHVYINAQNLGDYSNRNKAISYAKGKYIKFVDSDDKIFPETLKIMFSEMMNNPEAGFGVSSRTEIKSTLYYPHEAYYLHFFERGLLNYGPSGTIIDHEKLLSCGKFKEIRNVSDFDMWLRMAALFPVLELPKGLVYWRQHNDQEIKVAPDLYIEHTLSILEDNLLSEKCPLDQTQVNCIFKKYKHETSKQIVKRFVRNLDFKSCYKYWKINNLQISDLF